MIANEGDDVDETGKEIEQETDGLAQRRPRWRRFLSLFLKHLLPLLALALICALSAAHLRGGNSQGPIVATSIFLGILVLVMPIATRGSLESLFCFLLAVEGGALFLAYRDAWSVTWTRVVLLQLLVAGILLSWLTILRIRNRKFNTWLVLTELLTVLLFALLIYFRCTYWWA